MKCGYEKEVYNEANIFGAGTNAKDWPWDMVSIWMVLKLLQGSGTGGQGLLNNWRSLLWIKVRACFFFSYNSSLLIFILLKILTFSEMLARFNINVMLTLILKTK